MTDGEPLARLAGQGVSIWLDTISRDRLATGGLAQFVDGMHVTGITSNPTIFEQSINGSVAYTEQVRDLAIRRVPVEEAARLLTSYDVRWACDELDKAYHHTGGHGRARPIRDPLRRFVLRVSR